MQWPPQMSPEFLRRCEHLTQRHSEIAFFQTFRPRAEFDGSGSETVHDLNFTVTWENQTIAMAPTIVCTSILWLSRKQRQVCGVEALRLQGFPGRLADTLHSDHGLSLAQKMELAGNAFNGLVVSAVFIAVFKDVAAILDRAQTRVTQAQTKAGVTQTAVSQTVAIVDLDDDAIDGVNVAGSSPDQPDADADDAGDDVADSESTESI